MGDGVDTGIATEPEPRPRRSTRVAINAEVILRRSGQNNYRVKVYDVSKEGCKVEFVDRPTLDELVWVKFEGLEAMESLVCWVRGPRAGLEFRRPFYAPVYETLLRRHNAGAPDQDQIPPSTGS